MALTAGNTFFSIGESSFACLIAKPRTPFACGPRRLNISSTVGVNSSLLGFLVSISLIKAERRAIGVFFSGAEACPPVECAITFMFPVPFSIVPIIAYLPLTPAIGSSTIMPPSSIKNWSLTLCSFSHSTVLGAPEPATSSVEDDAIYTSPSGIYPSSISSSILWKIHINEPLVSTVPRPQILSSLISPENGGYFHSPSAGTTSWWDINKIGSALPFPFHFIRRDESI